MKAITLIYPLLLAALRLTAAPLPATEYKMSLDAGWTFALGHAASMQADFTHGTEYFTYFTKVASNRDNHGPASPRFVEDGAWRPVTLPHDWVVDLPYDGAASHSHGYKCVGWKYPENSVGWYRRHLEIPAEDRGRQIWIEFEGIFRDSQVFVNGCYLGGEKSGYASRVYDLSPYLNYGGGNLIAVRCDASVEEGWFYEGAGIYRHVWLHKAGPVAAAPYSVLVTADDIRFEPVYADASVDPARVSVRKAFYDAGGREVPAMTHRWSLDDPYLYGWKLQLYYDGVLSAEYTGRSGVRDIAFDAQRGFLLNGERVQLRGCDLHLDHAGVGVAVPDALWRYKLGQLRKYGFNAIRCSHNPASPAMLDLCDELGFAVIDEQRQFGVNAEQTGQFENMILRDRNHPSVILWSVGNEEWAVEWNETGTRIARHLSDLAHRLDPTRPTTYGSSGGPHPNRGVDVFGFNYVIQNNIQGLLREFPGRTGVGTEETTGSGTRGKYVTVPERGWMQSLNRSGVDNRPMGGDPDAVCSPETHPMSAEGAVLEVIARGWKYYAAHPNLGGLFYWTGFDYRGEPNPMVWPATGSQFGILDYCGFPKDEAFYLQSVWTEAPMLHVAPHWNHPVPEGTPVPVVVYTNCERVTLQVNGRRLGSKRVGENESVRWEVPYRPGRVEAVGYRGGRVAVRTVLETTGPAADVRLTASSLALKRDGADVVVVDIEALDARGRFVPDAEMPLTVRVEGAELLGWGNGDPGFKAVERPLGADTLDIVTFSGCAQVLVRSRAEKTGPVTVSVGSRSIQLL